MDSLSKDQITFLTKHNISPKDVFKAKGMTRNIWRREMKKLDMRFAYGVTPCKKMGHTLRSRAGHCIQCDPSRITFMNRYCKKNYERPLDTFEDPKPKITNLRSKSPKKGKKKLVGPLSTLINEPEDVIDNTDKIGNLTKDQIDFLSKHNISLGVVFNAKGLKRNIWKRQMKILDMRFVYGVTPCKKMGHTLRSRAGHCIQCDPDKIAFTNRYFEEGYVYVSISSKKNFLKIGCANNVQKRESGLNDLSYGGTNDWETIFSVKSKNAGKIEFDTHKKLSQFYFPVDYYRNGVIVTCREIFKCEKNFAIEKIKKIIRDNTK